MALWNQQAQQWFFGNAPGSAILDETADDIAGAATSPAAQMAAGYAVARNWQRIRPWLGRMARFGRGASPMAAVLGMTDWDPAAIYAENQRVADALSAAGLADAGLSVEEAYAVAGLQMPAYMQGGRRAPDEIAFEPMSGAFDKGPPAMHSQTNITVNVDAGRDAQEIGEATANAIAEELQNFNASTRGGTVR